VPQLGRRGGGWVVVQFVLIGLYPVVAARGPDWSGPVSGGLMLLGWALVLAGVVVAGLAARVLGRGLTPLPDPEGRETFVAHGPYGIVRHPFYLGALLVLLGLSLALSPWALVVTGTLGLVWALKATVEERFLLARYPAYAEYCERTRFRLVPFVY
jgi:protein-S-isoprenylcysteine O-methyltransferase Ste14